ncbi:unnamed protein product, partial [marine sediment metagenome]
MLGRPSKGLVSRTTFLSFVVLVLATSLVMCTSSKPVATAPPDAGEPAAVIPQSTALKDVLPDVPLLAAVPYVAAKHHGILKQEAAGATIGPVQFTRYKPVSEHVGGSSLWAFTVGEDGLEAKLGQDFVVKARAQLVAAYRKLLEQNATRASLDEAVHSFPNLSTVDLRPGWNLDQMVIQAITLSDGEMTDQDGDGTPETPRTLLSVRMAMPAFDIGRPKSPFPTCKTVLADASALTQRAQDMGNTFAAPDAATWNYQISLTGNFYVEDMATTHTFTRRADGLGTQHDRDAAANDLGVIRHFLEHFNATEFAESDLAVSFAAGAAL